MEVIKGKGLSIANGRSLETAGKLPEAADIYQQMVDRDPVNQQALSRLLLIYRKLKEYRKELTAIDAALSAYQEKDDTKQSAWLKAHPKAAGAGKAMLKTLGGASATAFGVNPAVARLLKRKELVERKVTGAKGKAAKGRTAKKKTSKKKLPPKKTAPHPLRIVPDKARTKQQKKAEAAEKKRIAAEARREKAEQQRQEKQRRKEEAAEARKQAAEKRKAELAEERERIRQEKQNAKDAAAAAKKAATEAKGRPSLFVVSLRYLVSLEKIDNAMDEHLAFLDKHYRSGAFLVSGRQVPRTGGIIIARGRNRDAIERLMKQDPFVKKKYASIDIVEFSASRSVEALGRWLKK